MSDVTLQFESAVAGDDGYWTSDGSFYNNSANLYTVYGFSGVNRYSFITFKNIIIPKGAIITNAVLKLRNVDDFGAGAQNYNIYFEDTTVPVTLSNAAEAEALVLTDPVAWAVAQRSAAYYTTSDLKTILQGVVDKISWTIGKSIRAVIKQPSATAGLPYWKGLLGGPTVIPVLEVTWTLPSDWLLKNSGVSGDDGWHVGATWKSTETSIAFGKTAQATLYEAFTRFPAVAIPNANLINHAYLIMVTKTAAGNAEDLVCYFNDADDAVAPTDETTYNAKTLTGGVAWSGGFRLAERIYNSPDLAADLQAVINRAAWVSGNALMNLIKCGTAWGEVYAYSYDNGSKYPLLLINTEVPPLELLGRFIAEPRQIEIGYDEDNVPNNKDVLQYDSSFEVYKARSLSDAGIVAKALYDANSILIANIDDTPIVLPVAASTILGRKATGSIDDLSPTEARVVLGLAVGDSPVFVTVKLSGLADGKIPYHFDDATGLADGPIKTDVDDAVTKKHTQGTDTALGAVGTKNPPIDADKAIYRDSASSDALVTSTWTQIKAFLKTYFDTLYNLYVHPNHSGDVTSVADGAQTIANKQTLSATSPITVSNTPTVIAAVAPVIVLVNDAAATITEIDTGALANIDTVIPTSKAVTTAISGFLSQQQIMARSLFR